MHAYLFIMKILRTVHSKKSKEEKQSKSLKQEAQLMLTNPRDALRDQSRSPNIVPFHMLGIFPLVQLSLRRAVFPIFDLKNVVTLKSGSAVTQGH